MKTIAKYLGLIVFLCVAIFGALTAHAWGGGTTVSFPPFTGTLTSTLTFSGVTTDITTVGNEDLTIAPAGTGKPIFALGGNLAQFKDSNANVDLEIATGANDANVVLRQVAGGASGGGVRITSGLAQIGVVNDATANGITGCFGDNLTATGAGTNLFCAYGTGMVGPIPGTPLAISGTPDVTRSPISAGSSCRFAAAAGGQSWTPAESIAVDGMEACCTNTGANSVTITASSGVFEGAGGAVAQWKTICMDYVTDRWVQRGSITP